MAAAVIAFAACQNNKETEITAEESIAAEAPANSTAIAGDTVWGAETTAAVTAEPAKPEDKAADVKAVKPANDIKVDYASFGDKILADKALSNEEMMKKYKSLKQGDTLNIKFKSKINAVCQKKGCWMSMALPGGKETFVKFKDYAFFVPLNATNQDAIVSGKAFISETSVAQLRHYAKDGGESDAAIAKITEPKVEYKFMADGVLISR